jgi:N-acetylmuramoyl-L-alanine amidase
MIFAKDIFINMATRRIFISAGHSNKIGKDRGAVSEFGVEGVLMVEFRDLLNRELQKLDICPILDKDDSILQDTINYFRKLTSNNDIILDFHLNSSSNKDANGTETIIAGLNTTDIEKNLGKEINDIIVKTLGTKNRGVKTDVQLGRTLGFFKIAGHNILPELVFLSNKEDMEKYQKHKITLATEIAKVIKKYI